MRLHFVTVPIHGGAVAEDELNQFLASHRVIAVDRQLVTDGARSAWVICITYVDAGATAAAGANVDTNGKKSRVDYREVLPDDEFQVFAELRDLRKKLADRDGVPPYALFTNEQLAEMVRRHVRSTADLARLDGVGPARIEKYGPAFLANTYLDAFDRFLLEELRVRGLVRYMDDVVWWCDTREAARTTLEAARTFLARERGLELKPDARIARSGEGLPFLGFRVLPGTRRLSLRRRRRYVAARARWEAAFAAGRMDGPGLQAGYAAALAITAHADAAAFRRAELGRRAPLDA